MTVIQTTPMELLLLVVLVSLLPALVSTVWVTRALRHHGQGEQTAAPTKQADLDTLPQLAAQLHALQRSQAALQVELTSCRDAVARIHRQLPSERIGSASQRATATVRPTTVEAPAAARPPQRLMPQPLARPAPVAETIAQAVELSDAEIDALPPDLPALDKARKRVLPAPRKPTLQRL